MNTGSWGGNRKFFRLCPAPFYLRVVSDFKRYSAGSKGRGKVLPDDKR